MDFAYILSRAVAQGLPLLFGSNGEILNEKSGNLNDFASDVVVGVALFIILSSEFFINYRIVFTKKAKEGK